MILFIFIHISADVCLRKTTLCKFPVDRLTEDKLSQHQQCCILISYLFWWHCSGVAGR